MTRTISAALTTAIGLDVVAPGYLVEIQFATPLRLSSRGTLSWSGNTWTAWDVRVQGLAADAGGSSASGSLLLGDADYTIAALALSEGVANRPVNVWKFYGDTAPATGDPVQVFAGVGDGVDLEPNRGMVTIRLVQTNARALFAPRFYITPEAGFTYLPAPGTVIDWDGERYVLESEQ